jgi:hypothetical protein
MTTKPYHGVTLWAVPRFHRSEFPPLQAEATPPQPAKLQTYSFSLDAETPPKDEKTEIPERCH